MKESFMSQGFLPRAHTMIPDSNLHQGANFSLPNDLSETIKKNDTFLAQAKSSLLGDRDEQGLHQGNGIIGRMQTQRANDDYLQRIDERNTENKAKRDAAILESAKSAKLQAVNQAKENIEMLSYDKRNQEITKATGFQNADDAINAYNTQLQSMGFNDLNHFAEVYSQLKSGSIQPGTPRYTQLQTLLRKHNDFFNGALATISAMEDYKRRSTNPLTQDDRVYFARRGLESGLYQNVNQALTDLKNRDETTSQGLKAQVDSQGHANSLYKEPGFLPRQGGGVSGGGNFVSQVSQSGGNTNFLNRTGEETTTEEGILPNIDENKIPETIDLQSDLAKTYRYRPKKLNQTTAAQQFEDNHWADNDSFIGNVLNTLNLSKIGMSNDYAVFNPHSRFSQDKINRFSDNVTTNYNKNRYDSKGFFSSKNFNPIEIWNKDAKLKDNYGLAKDFDTLDNALNAYENGIGKEFDELASQGKLPENPKQAAEAVTNILNLTKNLRQKLDSQEQSLKATNNPEAIADFEILKKSIIPEIDRVEKDYKEIRGIFQKNNKEFLQKVEQQKKENNSLTAPIDAAIDEIYTNKQEATETKKEINKIFTSLEEGKIPTLGVIKSPNNTYSPNDAALIYKNLTLMNNHKGNGTLNSANGVEYFAKDKKFEHTKTATKALLFLAKSALTHESYMEFETQILNNTKDYKGMNDSEIIQAGLEKLGSSEVRRIFGSTLEGQGDLRFKGNSFGADYTRFTNAITDTLVKTLHKNKFETTQPEFYNLLSIYSPAILKQLTLPVKANR